MSAATGSPCFRPTLAVDIPPFIDTHTEVTKAPRNGKRCCFDGCKKKLSLTDFACKCGLIHCAAHRPSEAHKCSFDYKKNHESMLLKTMSTSVIASKVDKI